MSVKLTGAKLRRIIKEEIERMNEAVAMGGGISTGQQRPKPVKLADVIRKNPEAMDMIDDLRDQLGLPGSATPAEALEALLDTSLTGGMREGYLDDISANDLDPYGHRAAAERDVKAKERWVKALVGLGMSGTVAFLVYNIASAAGIITAEVTPHDVTNAITLALSTMPLAGVGGIMQMDIDAKRKKYGLGR